MPCKVKVIPSPLSVSATELPSGIATIWVGSFELRKERRSLREKGLEGKEMERVEKFGEERDKELKAEGKRYWLA